MSRNHRRGDAVAPELLQNYEKNDFFANYLARLLKILAYPHTTENWGLKTA